MEQRRIKPGSDEGGREPPEARHPPAEAPDKPPAAAEELAFLAKLESVIAQRIADKPAGSYTARLFAEGRSRIAQKVAEESVEVALAAVVDDDGKLVAEAADLLYHLLLLVKSRGLSLARVVRELESRHANRA